MIDLELLEEDAGLSRVLRHAETHGMLQHRAQGAEGQLAARPWRSVPSCSVVFRYLESVQVTQVDGQT